MTFSSVAQTNPKTAEFARLFDLFDRVATRRSRALTGDTHQVISADDIANVPTEFVPALKNLSTILSLRALRDEEHARRVETAPTPKPRNKIPPADASTSTTKPTAPKKQMPRIDVVTSPKKVTAEEDPESLAFSRVGERYPFTFKLMLHKLYDLNEWVEKVKDAVETSKSQFKPLAERIQDAVNLDVTADITPEKRAERRSSFRPQPVLGFSAKFKPPPTPLKPESKENSRVLKKRCIGRRKSINGPMSSGVWVYDAAISATEVAGPRPTVEITLSVPGDGLAEKRARHRSLTALEERGAVGTKIKIAVPLLATQEEVSESRTVTPRSSSLSLAKRAHEIVETNGVVKRRRSVVSALASESCKKAAVKRPLCV